MKAIRALRIIAKAILPGPNSEYFGFILAERISGMIYPKYKFSEFGRVFLEDSEFLQYYHSFVGTNDYHSLDRKYALAQLLKLVTWVEGDTAECGAYQGASSFLICRQTSGTDKRHHIFDSFEGLSDPVDADGTYWKSGDLATAEAAIRQNLRTFQHVIYHPGWIPERFHEVADRRFSFVHVDVDLFQPTLDSIRFFYERLSPNGIILCDDYGFSTCPGAKKAMDVFFQDKLEEIVHLPTGQAFIIKRPGLSGHRA